MIRILIADDHLVVREGLQLILGMEEDLAVVGEAADGAAAVRLAGELQPDVVLMDLRMPGMGGLEAIEQILARWPQMAIVILTTYNEDELMMRGLQAGARGFLLKDTDRETLFHTIRAAARGETLLGPEVMARLMAHTDPASGPGADHADDEVLLTERELEVLTAVARGERNKEIGRDLGVTERTIKAHLTNIYNKLGVDSRAAAVSVALQRGIIRP
jgi:NarL family two-component system response regulator YdfI